MNEKNPNSPLRQRLRDLLLGSVLDMDLARKHISFLGLLAFLGFLAIQAAHRADFKVHEIAKLRTEVKDLESEYIETKSRLMQLSLESQVLSRAGELGLHKQQEPPKIIESGE
jgi:hypothetical protein